MASSVPVLFSHCLEASHMHTILALMVKPAFTLKDENAKFKLFSLVLSLQKIKVADNKKGFSSEEHLWLHDVNH